jgi:hypothetical protein
MPSPFLGIDPYVEAQGLWEGFLAGFITHGRGTINDLLPETYVAVIEAQLRLEVRHRWIEIRRLPKRAPVTVIEVLSPTSKLGDGFAEYQLKRKKIIEQKVHLVELDFLLGGQRLPMERSLPRGDYYALVSRAERRPDCDVYAWTIRDRLPRIPIPLQSPDPDVALDLGAVFTLEYERGRYERLLDYDAPLTLVRKADDRAWAEGIARRARR